MNRGKVVIVGAGMVGTSIAYSIVNQSLCGEIVVIDINENKAMGESLDMMHAMEFMNHKIIEIPQKECTIDGKKVDYCVLWSPINHINDNN